MWVSKGGGAEVQCEIGNIKKVPRPPAPDGVPLEGGGFRMKIKDTLGGLLEY